MKKILALCLVVALMATAIVGATLAYFTDDDEATNTFTVGNVEIDLTEPAWDDEEKNDVYPGEALAKDPTVTNTGANPCFVRIKVTGLDQFGDMGMITLRHGNYVEGYDSTNWTLIGDYYYYNEVLATAATAGDTWNQGLEAVSAPLFNQIVMPTGLTNSVEAKPIEIVAEAVQAQGARASWSEVKAMDAAAIAQWFTDCGR